MDCWWIYCGCLFFVLFPIDGSKFSAWSVWFSLFVVSIMIFCSNRFGPFILKSLSCVVVSVVVSVVFIFATAVFSQMFLCRSTQFVISCTLLIYSSARDADCGKI